MVKLRTSRAPTTDLPSHAIDGLLTVQGLHHLLVTTRRPVAWTRGQLRTKELRGCRAKPCTQTFGAAHRIFGFPHLICIAESCGQLGLYAVGNCRRRRVQGSEFAT